MALKTQDTLQKGEEPSCTRLKDTVRRFLEQKTKDRNFDARRDRLLSMDDSLKDNVRKVSRATSGTATVRKEREIQHGKKERGRKQTSLSRDSHGSSKGDDTDIEGKRPKRYQPIRKQRPASLQHARAGKVNEFFL